MNDQPKIQNDIGQRGYRTGQANLPIGAVLVFGNIRGWWNFSDIEIGLMVTILFGLQPFIASLRAFLESRGIIKDRRHKIPDVTEPKPVVKRKTVVKTKGAK